MNLFLQALAGSVLFYLILPTVLLILEMGRQKRLTKYIKMEDNSKNLFYGQLFSFDLNNQAWLQHKGDSCKINWSNAYFYRLVNNDTSDASFQLKGISKKEFSQHSQGVSLWCVGNINYEGNVKSILSSKEFPLYIIIYQGCNISWEKAVKQALLKGNYLQSHWLNRSIFLGTVWNILYLNMAISQNIPTGYVFFS
ncbi:MAG: hypothetical protein PF447_04415, partial [Spirochaetaceae bacterium]|nr:hypothetical protein [Spirochaetaceae bacterium]